jgi:membrane glycosyltransferase
MELHRSGELTAAPRAATTPPLARTPMAPTPWHASPAARAAGRGAGVIGHGPLEVAASRRRFVLLLLSLAPALYATAVMSDLLPNTIGGWLQGALLALFALLSCWVAAGFWTAMAGLLVWLRGGDRFLISRSIADATPLAPQARTAIVMPICNEDVRRVFAGLRATYESLARTGALESFDFFVLSDSNDPDTCVAELDAWNALREDLDAEHRLFYRRRTRRVKRKSGNIDDFCRKWGSKYRYMVVLDADSVMTGDCLVTLARLMEARPDAGIIQTAPQAVGRNTLHARAQQFANQVYGPLFTAGLHYWQLGESHYWGHNAIIRLEPFIRHCALAPLPGRGALSGEILSHDFVEAALMRRAGYGVWIAYDLEGSFEQAPPNLLEEIKRDRRWCQGNLMNARLVFARGLHSVHRTVFFTGALAYVSAPLWLGFLALSTWLLVQHGAADPQYFVMPHQLYPLWPSWRPEHAVALAAAIATLLFLPKVLAALLAGVRDASRYGGASALALSTLLEIVLSALLAPVRMMFHSRFVIAAIAGWTIQWNSPARADASTGWPEALRRHGLQTAIGLAWISLVALEAPEFLPWLLPVAAGLLLAAPLSVLTSRTGAGLVARRLGLLLTPAETRVPREIASAEHHAGNGRPLPRFADAMVDPELHALMRLAARRRTPLAAAARNARVQRALSQGPLALSTTEQLLVLGDLDALDALHGAIRARRVHPGWMSSRSQGRATIHQLAGRAEYRPGTVVTLARRG